MGSSRTFYASCVGWPREDVHVPGGLSDMIQTGRPISRRTFCRNVSRESREDLERCFGYAPFDRRAVLTAARDFHIRYFSGNLHGFRVYWLEHSAIEYVFISPAELTREGGGPEA